MSALSEKSCLLGSDLQEALDLIKSDDSSEGKHRLKNYLKKKKYFKKYHLIFPISDSKNAAVLLNLSHLCEVMNARSSTKAKGERKRQLWRPNRVEIQKGFVHLLSVSIDLS